jgi:hypothetical protein
VNLRHGGVLGSVPVNLRKVQVIPAGKNHDFSFSFRKEEFEVERGQQLRIVVAAWPDVQSMKTDEPPTRLASSSFECP